MAKNEQHGFDLVATRRRLEDWWLEYVSFPVGGGVSYWPGGRSESIRALLFEHWGEHGVYCIVEHNGVVVTVPRCLDAPCPVLGVALGLLEICAYEETSRDIQEIEWLKLAETTRSISESMRMELLAGAKQLASSPVSRAVENETAGRPKRMLAQAVTQQLRAGGFTYSDVAAFMGATVEVTRHRCQVRGVRSLSAVVGSPSAIGALTR